MEYNVRVNLRGTAFVIAGILGISIVTSTIVVSRMVHSRTVEETKSHREIDMRGSAKSRVRSDLAVWRVTVRGQGAALEATYDTVEKGTEAVRKFLGDQGFKPEEVGVGSIGTRILRARTAQGSELDDVAGYALDRVVTVTSSDVNRVAAASAAVTQLLRTGIQVISSQPEFTFTRLADLRVKLLGEASQDARTRADEIVRNTGGKVGLVRDVRTNPIQITEPNSTEISGSGRYDTGTIEKDVTAIVNVTFWIE